MQATSAARQPEKQRLFYLDNLRTFLTALVICHHAANVYSPVGNWYYMTPSPQDSISGLFLTIFIVIDQAFFMSLFFLVSAYFTPMSYDRKGPALFLKDRFARLGIPILVYFFFLEPTLDYIVFRHRGEIPAGYLSFMSVNFIREAGTGPHWFVLSLLIFAVA